MAWVMVATAVVTAEATAVATAVADTAAMAAMAEAALGGTVACRSFTDYNNRPMRTLEPCLGHEELITLTCLAAILPPQRRTQQQRDAKARGADANEKKRRIEQMSASRRAAPQLTLLTAPPLQEGTRGTFQTIEGLVFAVSSVAAMLESSYDAVYSSFMSVFCQPWICRAIVVPGHHSVAPMSPTGLRLS